MKLNDYKDRSVFYDLEFSDTSDTDLIFNNLLNGFKGRILEIPCGSCRFLDICNKTNLNTRKMKGKLQC